MTRVLLSLFVLLALTGCSRVEREEVIGTYVLNNSPAEFTLQLKPDGTYVHTSVTSKGERVERTGTGEWDEKDADNPLCLDNFAEFPEEDIGGTPDSPGYFILHPERSMEGVRFPVGDPDSPSLYFVRRDSQPH